MPRDPDDISAQNARNALYMVHSMAHWQKTVHGFSGVLPDEHHNLYRAMAAFPSDDALDRMRKLGVTYVIFHADMNNSEERGWVDGLFAPFAHSLLLVHEEVDGRAYLLSSAR